MHHLTKPVHDDENAGAPLRIDLQSTTKSILMKLQRPVSIRRGQSGACDVRAGTPHRTEPTCGPTYTCGANRSSEIARDTSSRDQMTAGGAIVVLVKNTSTKINVERDEDARRVILINLIHEKLAIE